MATCPLLGKECIREQCAWWSEAEEYSQCVITLLSELIDDIGDYLASEVSGISDTIELETDYDE